MFPPRTPFCSSVGNLPGSPHPSTLIDEHVVDERLRLHRTCSTRPAADRPRRVRVELCRGSRSSRGRDGGDGRIGSSQPGSSPAATRSCSSPRPRSSYASSSRSSCLDGHHHVLSAPRRRTDARATGKLSPEELVGSSRDGRASSSGSPAWTTRSAEPTRWSRRSPRRRRSRRSDAHPAIGARGLSARSAAEQGSDADPAVLSESSPT